jgi:hypothetical protein
MTPDAIFPDRECSVVIMARATRLVLIHVPHCRPRPGIAEREYFGMAFGALVQACMKSVGEYHWTSAAHFHKYISRNVAAGTFG